MKIALRSFVFLAVLVAATSNAIQTSFSAPLPVPAPGQPSPGLNIQANAAFGL